jgi:hypothetical protein
MGALHVEAKEPAAIVCGRVVELLECFSDVASKTNCDGYAAAEVCRLPVQLGERDDLHSAEINVTDIQDSNQGEFGGQSKLTAFLASSARTVRAPSSSLTNMVGFS